MHSRHRIGKPPAHAEVALRLPEQQSRLGRSMIFSESRYPLFGIMF